MDQPVKHMTPDEMASFLAQRQRESNPGLSNDAALSAYVQHRTSVELANAIRETLPDVLPAESVQSIANDWASSGQFVIKDGAVTTRDGRPAAEEVKARLGNRLVAEALLTTVSHPPEVRAARLAHAASQPPASRGIGLRPIGKRGA